MEQSSYLEQSVAVKRYLCVIVEGLLQNYLRHLEWHLRESDEPDEKLAEEEVKMVRMWLGEFNDQVGDAPVVSV